MRVEVLHQDLAVGAAAGFEPGLVAFGSGRRLPIAAQVRLQATAQQARKRDQALTVPAGIDQR